MGEEEEEEEEEFDEFSSPFASARGVVDSESASKEAEYSDICLGPDGNLYCCPFDANNVAVLDPSTGKIDILQHDRLDLGNELYSGICLGPDGRLYCAPCAASNVLVISPRTKNAEERLRFIDGHIEEGRHHKYGGICMGPDRRLYCAPLRTSHMLVIDPVKQMISFIEGTGSGFMGICAAPSGKLYCAPYSAGHVLEVHVKQGQASEIDFIRDDRGGGIGKYAGIAAAPDGRIYSSMESARSAGHRSLRPGWATPALHWWR